MKLLNWNSQESEADKQYTVTLHTNSLHFPLPATGNGVRRIKILFNDGNMQDHIMKNCRLWNWLKFEELSSYYQHLYVNADVVHYIIRMPNALQIVQTASTLIEKRTSCRRHKQYFPHRWVINWPGN